MPTLNLMRDAGFLFHDVTSAEDRQAIARDLRHLLNDLEMPDEFASSDEFQKAQGSQISGCNGQSVWKFSDIFKQRVHQFFADVNEAFPLGGDVFYDIKPDVQKNQMYDGADFFVDYKTSCSAFSRQFVRPEQGMILNPDSQDMSYELTGFWAATALPRDVVRELQQAEIGKKQLAEEFNFFDFLNPEQRAVAIRHRYFPMVAGLRDEDKKSIIKMALDDDFVRRRKCDFAIYTQAPALRDLCRDWMTEKAGDEDLVPALTDKLRKKYKLHRDYAEELAKNLPDVSADLILSMVLIESNGDRMSQNGQFLGLMQVGKNEFEKYVDENLPDDVRRNASHYKAGLSAGANYLQEWCFGTFNPEQQLAVAVGNYNWGCGNMRDYRRGKVNLRQETRDYLAKLLVFSRLFSELGVQ